MKEPLSVEQDKDDNQWDGSKGVIKKFAVPVSVNDQSQAEFADPYLEAHRAIDLCANEVSSSVQNLPLLLMVRPQNDNANLWSQDVFIPSTQDLIKNQLKPSKLSILVNI